MLGSVLPKSDTSQVLELAKFDLGRIAGLYEIGKDIRQVNSAFAHIQELSKVTLSPSMLAAFAAMQSPGPQATITVARSPTEGDEADG